MKQFSMLWPLTIIRMLSITMHPSKFSLLIRITGSKLTLPSFYGEA
jgi:hypothetical protein